MDGTELEPHPTFVVNTIMVEVRSIICQAAEKSFLTASVFIGNIDLAKEPISVEKIEIFFTHLNKTLGFITDYR